MLKKTDKSSKISGEIGIASSEFHEYDCKMSTVSDGNSKVRDRNVRFNAEDNGKNGSL